MQPAVSIDPAGRPPWRERGAWRIWLGWIAAAALHAILLAALIFERPSGLAPPADRPSVSLMILPAEKSAPPAVAVRPKPSAVTPESPAALPLKIAIGQPVRQAKPAPPARAVAPVSRAVVQAKPMQQQEGDKFVVAAPVTSNFNQPPEYPAQAQAHGEQGDVLLSIHVLATGEADSVSVTQSSGYDVLDQAAAKAVWKWRFQPSTLSGQPVPSVIPYRIHFDLRSAPASDP